MKDSLVKHEHETYNHEMLIALAKRKPLYKDISELSCNFRVIDLND